MTSQSSKRADRPQVPSPWLDLSDIGIEANEETCKGSRRSMSEGRHHVHSSFWLDEGVWNYRFIASGLAVPGPVCRSVISEQGRRTNMLL